MITITAASTKGGAGKSLLIVGLASAIHDAGKKVCVIDFDPQGTLGGWLDDEEGERLSGSLDVEALPLEGDDRERLKAASSRLRSLQAEGLYDYLLIDTKGEAGLTTALAMGAADYVLCPTSGASVEFEPIVATFMSYKASMARLDPDANPNDHFRVVYTRQSPIRARETLDTLAALKRHYICIDGINESTAFNAAHMHRTTIGRLAELAEGEAKTATTSNELQSARRMIGRCQKALANCSDVLNQIVSEETNHE